MKLNGAQLVVKCLEAQGVKTVFGIPGAKIDAVFDALKDSAIRLIVCRHEQNAAFLAACYGRLTGQPGVVLVTSGPGVANLATGLLTATTEGDPVVALGGNVARTMHLKESHQSLNNVKLMEAVTKYCVEPTTADNITEAIFNAFRSALSFRRGAAFVSLPQDVLNEVLTMDPVKPHAQPFYGPAPADLIQQAATLLNQAELPVILLGQEASLPDNAAAVRKLLQSTPFPVAGTYQAAGVISRELEQYFVGRVGLFKNQPGDRLLEAADVVLTIGYNPVEYDPEIWNTAHESKKIIHVDYQRADMHLAYYPNIELSGDIQATITQLSTQLIKRDPRNIFVKTKELHDRLYAEITSGKSLNGQLIHPLRFIYELREALDDDTVVVCDIGTVYMWMARYFLSYQPRHLLFSNGQQTLGVAIPWAMAAHLAHPQKRIISISGDGGFLFSSMELETAVREKIPLIHFVWTDHSYNMVSEQEVLKYKRKSGVELGHIDLVKYAQAFGAKGYLLDDINNFRHILDEAFHADVPVLIDVTIDYSHNAALFKSVGASFGN